MFHCEKVSLIRIRRIRVLTVDVDGGLASLDGGMPSHSPEMYMDMLAFDG